MFKLALCLAVLVIVFIGTFMYILCASTQKIDDVMDKIKQEEKG